MLNFDKSVTEGFNLVLKQYCNSNKKLKNCRQWSVYADKEKTALVTTIWNKINEDKKLYSLDREGDRYVYRIPIECTEGGNQEGENHIKRFSFALNNNIPIYGILKCRKSGKLSSMGIYKLNARDSGNIGDNQKIRIFDLEDVNRYEEGFIESPNQLKIYIENRFRGRYTTEAIESAHMHSIILNKLTKSLKGKLMEGEVINTEYKIDDEQADLVIIKNNAVTAIYEIKTQDSMKMNIRAALGQLISYSRIIDNPQKRLVIVSNASVDEDGENFLKYVGFLLKEKIIALEYICLE
jgi:hypothetical protein